jgi:hypothetical protein
MYRMSTMKRLVFMVQGVYNENLTFCRYFKNGQMKLFSGFNALLLTTRV